MIKMNLMPKIKLCPSCNSFNLLMINGITYVNDFPSLMDWTLKKKFNCRKCKVELGLFINNTNKKEEKVIWFDLLECEENHLKTLSKLEKNKIKYKEKNKSKEYHKIINEIETVQNQIRLDQAKIKIKVKIQNIHNKTLLI